MRAVVVVLALAAFAAPARASHCHETTPVVGLEQCRRFGWWSHIGTFGLEVGAVMLHFDPGVVATDAYGTKPDGTLATYHVVGAGPVTAAGVRIRMMLSWGRHLHIGGEADLADIVDGPALAVADTAARSTMTLSDAGGSLGAAKLVVGEHVAIGPVTFAGELAPGLRIATYTLDMLPPAVTGPAQAWGVIEAHARAELWLTPQISLASEAGCDVLRPHDVSVSVAIGLHMLPYDNAR